MAKASAEDATILEYALKALEQERDHLQTRIDGIRRMIGGARASTKPAPAPASDGTAPKGRKKRVLSEAARKRIAAAQKKRWAEHRKSQAAPARATKKVAAKRAQAAE